MSSGPDRGDGDYTAQAERYTLPFASFVAQRSPNHPLPRLIIDPLVPRVAAVEAALLTSRPAQLVLRLGIASERSVVACALVALAALLARWRSQWRAVLWALGLGEALGRTLRLLQRCATPSAGDRMGKSPAGGHEDEVDDYTQETQHVLSFWLFLAALNLVDTLRSASSGAPSMTTSALSLLGLPQRVRAAMSSARQTVLHFFRLYVLPSFLRLRWTGRALIKKYPALDPAPRLAYWTAFPYAFPSLYRPSSSKASPSPRRAIGSFPQPRSRPWDPVPTSLPLSWSYFAYPSTSSASSFTSASIAPTYSPRAIAAAEARWELVKLILLWIGLRRDAWGAKSLVWDWTISPLLGVMPSRGVDAEGEETVLHVVRERRPRFRKDSGPTTTRESFEQPRPQASQDDHPDLLDSPTPSRSSVTSATPRRPAAAAIGAPSPYALSWTPPRPTATQRAASAANRSASLSPSRTASLASTSRSRATFTLQDPPAARQGAGPGATASQMYVSAVANHPLLAGANAHPRGSRGRIGQYESETELLPSAVMDGEATRPRRNRRQALGDEERGGSENDDDMPPPTPGEEEAEEGARRWATVLAEAHAAERLLDAEGEVGMAVVEAATDHAGEPGWIV